MVFLSEIERDFWMKIILSDQKSQTNDRRSVKQMEAKADELIYAFRRRNLNLVEQY